MSVRVRAASPSASGPPLYRVHCSSVGLLSPRVRPCNTSHSREIFAGPEAKTDLSVTLLDLASLLREDDEAGLVCLEPLLVQLEALLTPVAPAVVDGDTDREGLLAPDAGSLELIEGEATAGTELGVVPVGGAADGRAEELGRPADRGSQSVSSEMGWDSLEPAGAGLRNAPEASLDGLRLTSSTARALLAGLVEPGLDPGLPAQKKVGPP